MPRPDTSSDADRPDGPPYAFVSYSRRDQMRVRAEIAEIRAWGYKVWFDDQIRPTKDWPDEIAHALANCALFILFLTRNSADSRNVRNEVNFALDEQTSILAVYLEEVQLPPGLRLRIGDTQAIDKTRSTPKRYREQLQEAIAAALGAAPPPPDPAAQDGVDRSPPVVDLGQLGM